MSVNCPFSMLFCLGKLRWLKLVLSVLETGVVVSPVFWCWVFYYWEFLEDLFLEDLEVFENRGGGFIGFLVLSVLRSL